MTTLVIRKPPGEVSQEGEKGSEKGRPGSGGKLLVIIGIALSHLFKVPFR